MPENEPLNSMDAWVRKYHRDMGRLESRMMVLNRKQLALESMVYNLCKLYYDSHCSGEEYVNFERDLMAKISKHLGYERTRI